MNESHDAIEAAIQDVDRLRRTLKRGQTAQVRSSEGRALVKATALAWFNNHRSVVLERLATDDIRSMDELYKKLLAGSDRASTRSGYVDALKTLRQDLIAAKSLSVMPVAPPAAPSTTDLAPSFSTLVTDPAMQTILDRRWNECVRCIAAGAPLAATVMMGGLLEGLLLAKVNSQPKLAKVFTAKGAPKDRKTGNTLPLSEWTLKSYIDVAHELGWISQSARDIGAVLRDYRNYVHPQKELSHGVQLVEGDAALLWEVSKSITRQLL